MISIWERHLLNKHTNIKLNELKTDLHCEIRRNSRGSTRAGTEPGGQALWAAVLLPDAHCVPLPLCASLTLLVTMEQTPPVLVGQNKHISAFSFPQYNKKKINPKSTFTRIKDFGFYKSQNTKTEGGSGSGQRLGVGWGGQRDHRQVTLKGSEVGV